MQTTIIILLIIGIFIAGFIILYRRQSWTLKKFTDANEYRDKFIEFSNKYFDSYDSYTRTGQIDNSLYQWLTMNVNKIQADMGYFGVVDYLAPFRTHKVTNYRVLINTIPKYRDGDVKDRDVNLVDDCFLRYLGFVRDKEAIASKNLKNPLIWFREGIRTIVGIPLLILNSFGIFNTRTVERITDNIVFKILSGIIALVTLVSGIVTIIIGYDQTIKFISDHFSRH